MADCHLVAVCSGWSVDQITNNLTIFEIVEEVHAGALPFSDSGLLVVSMWTFSPDEVAEQAELEVRVYIADQPDMAPQGNELELLADVVSQPFPIKVTARRTRLRLFGFQANRAGHKRVGMQYRHKDDEQWLSTTAYAVVELNVEGPPPTSDGDQDQDDGRVQPEDVQD